MTWMSLIESAAGVGRGVTVSLSVLAFLLVAVTSRDLWMILGFAALLALFNLYVFAYTDLTVKATRAWNPAVALLLGVGVIALIVAMAWLDLGFWATAVLGAVVALVARWLVSHAVKRASMRSGQQETPSA